jgi:hypothetical protein
MQLCSDFNAGVLVHRLEEKSLRSSSRTEKDTRQV